MNFKISLKFYITIETCRERLNQNNSYFSNYNVHIQINLITYWFKKNTGLIS